MTRDQSEDRAQPEYLVAGVGLHGDYQVLRAADRKVMATFYARGLSPLPAGQRALEFALALETGYA